MSPLNCEGSVGRVAGFTPPTRPAMSPADGACALQNADPFEPVPEENVLSSHLPHAPKARRRPEQAHRWIRDLTSTVKKEEDTMAETLVRRDPITGTDVPRCDVPEDVVLRALRGKMHSVHVHIEPGEELLVEAMLPNFDASDITIDVHQGKLLIQAERYEDDQNVRYVVRGSNTFYRSVTLPHDANERLVTAHFHDGTLRVTVPLGGRTTHPLSLLPLSRAMKLPATPQRRSLRTGAEETPRMSAEQANAVMTPSMRVLETLSTVPGTQRILSG